MICFMGTTPVGLCDLTVGLKHLIGIRNRVEAVASFFGILGTWVVFKCPVKYCFLNQGLK